MGPPSDNGGYAACPRRAIPLRMLQWVHRLITVVMKVLIIGLALGAQLQWVHRLITVVMYELGVPSTGGGKASMGPPSDNGGYALSCSTFIVWSSCFNGSTV